MNFTWENCLNVLCLNGGLFLMEVILRGEEENWTSGIMFNKIIYFCSVNCSVNWGIIFHNKNKTKLLNPSGSIFQSKSLALKKSRLFWLGFYFWHLALFPPPTPYNWSRLTSSDTYIRIGSMEKSLDSTIQKWWWYF